MQHNLHNMKKHNMPSRLNTKQKPLDKLQNMSHMVVLLAPSVEMEDVLNQADDWSYNHRTHDLEEDSTGDSQETSSAEDQESGRGTGRVDAPVDAEEVESPIKKLCAGVHATAIADKKPVDATAL